MAFSTAQRLEQLSVPTGLAKELGTQLDTGVYSVFRLIEMGMLPGLAKIVVSEPFDQNKAVQLGMIPNVALFVAGKRWHPSRLGTSLFDMWDAERPDLFSLSGSSVNSWISVKNSYSADQTTGSAKPAYSATSFNGRPGVSFDGIDDELTYPGVGIFPQAAVPCEIWVLADQQALAADATIRAFFGYGTPAAGAERRVRRNVISSTNRANVLVSGVQATSAAVDLIGRHVIRGEFGATASAVSVDGTAPVSAAIVPTTGNVRTRIGAAPTDAASQFAQSVFSLIAVTDILSVENAALMTAYLKTRGGVA